MESSVRQWTAKAAILRQRRRRRRRTYVFKFKLPRIFRRRSEYVRSRSLDLMLAAKLMSVDGNVDVGADFEFACIGRARFRA